MGGTPEFFCFLFFRLAGLRCACNINCVLSARLRDFMRLCPGWSLDASHAMQCGLCFTAKRLHVVGHVWSSELQIPRLGGTSHEWRTCPLTRALPSFISQWTRSHSVCDSADDRHSRRTRMSWLLARMFRESGLRWKFAGFGLVWCRPELSANTRVWAVGEGVSRTGVC